MITIVNKVLPLGGFKAMAFWPFLFIKSGKNLDDTTKRHENIHGRQQIEMLLVFFYIGYGVSWLIEMVRCAKDKERGQIIRVGYKKRNYWHRIAHTVVFEREAYGMENDEEYLKRRKLWAWRKF